jgi:hypothetical protein
MLHSALSSRSILARPLFAIAVVALLAGCGGSDTSTGPLDVSGNYTLSTIDGSPVPYAVPNSGNIIVNSAIATLNADHSYTFTAAGSVNGVGSPDVASDAGTYTVSGSTVTLTSTTFGGATYTAAATSTTLTVTIPGAAISSSSPSFVLVLNKTS